MVSLGSPGPVSLQPVPVELVLEALELDALEELCDELDDAWVELAVVAPPPPPAPPVPTGLSLAHPAEKKRDAAAPTKALAHRERFIRMRAPSLPRRWAA
jgi:hypothetical protein